MFGEKEWSAIYQRFLPDRPANVIPRRYAKLCVLMYKACGVCINDSSGDLTSSSATATSLTAVDAPAKFNVNRWSFEEDVALLKAVPILGHSWAEINNEFIKHRNRGHLRKRYKLLERRIKAGVKRDPTSTSSNASTTTNNNKLETTSRKSSGSSEVIAALSIAATNNNVPLDPKVKKPTNGINETAMNAIFYTRPTTETIVDGACQGQENCTCWPFGYIRG